MRNNLLVVALLWVFVVPVFAAESGQPVPAWELSSDAQGIRIWTRQIPGHPVKDFRALMTVDAPMATVVATLTDVNTFPHWFWMMNEARVLEGVALDDAYLYFSLKPIWPVSARDTVIRARVSQDPSTLAVSIDVHAEPGRIPPVKDHVRIPAMKSGWKLTPLSKTQTSLELIGHADPGGYIPLWLANMVVTVMPKETFKKLRRHLLDPRYREPEAMYGQNPMLRDLMGRISMP
ncbi:MAG: START domain-containing protein [Gammaproteobacteria bacterium]